MNDEEKPAAQQEFRSITTSNYDPTAPTEYNMKKLKEESSIYRWVILFIGVSVLLVIIAVSILVGLGKTPPEGLIAIGSAAIGAMAGLLAPSPLASK